MAVVAASLPPSFDDSGLPAPGGGTGTTTTGTSGSSTTTSTTTNTTTSPTSTSSSSTPTTTTTSTTPFTQAELTAAMNQLRAESALYITRQQALDLINAKALTEEDLERFAPQQPTFLYILLTVVFVVSAAGLVTAGVALKKPGSKATKSADFEELIVYFRMHKEVGSDALRGMASRHGWKKGDIEEAILRAGL